MHSMRSDEESRALLSGLWSYHYLCLFICISLWMSGNVAELFSGSAPSLKAGVCSREVESQKDALSSPQIINAWGRWRRAVSCSTGEKVVASGECKERQHEFWFQHDASGRLYRNMKEKIRRFKSEWVAVCTGCLCVYLWVYACMFQPWT